MSQSTDATLTEVVSQNADAVEQIKAASNELGVIHAVLSTQGGAAEASSDAQAAVERTEEVGQQLAETAEVLEKNTEMLRELVAGSEIAPRDKRTK